MQANKLTLGDVTLDLVDRVLVVNPRDWAGEPYYLAEEVPLESLNDTERRPLNSICIQEHYITFGGLKHKATGQLLYLAKRYEMPEEE